MSQISRFPSREVPHLRLTFSQLVVKMPNSLGGNPRLTIYNIDGEKIVEGNGLIRGDDVSMEIGNLARRNYLFQISGWMGELQSASIFRGDSLKILAERK